MCGWALTGSEVCVNIWAEQHLLSPSQLCANERCICVYVNAAKGCHIDWLTLLYAWNNSYTRQVDVAPRSPELRCHLRNAAYILPTTNPLLRLDKTKNCWKCGANLSLLMQFLFLFLFFNTKTLKWLIHCFRMFCMPHLGLCSPVQGSKLALCSHHLSKPLLFALYCLLHQ